MYREMCRLLTVNKKNINKVSNRMRYLLNIFYPKTCVTTAICSETIWTNCQVVTSTKIVKITSDVQFGKM